MDRGLGRSLRTIARRVEFEVTFSPAQAVAVQRRRQYRGVTALQRHFVDDARQPGGLPAPAAVPVTRLLAWREAQRTAQHARAAIADATLAAVDLNVVFQRQVPFALQPFAQISDCLLYTSRCV